MDRMVNWIGLGYVGRGVGVDVKSWSKKLFLGTFWKIATYWPPLDERVRSSFAESCKNQSHYLQNLIGFHGFFVQKIIHYIENKNG